MKSTLLEKTRQLLKDDPRSIDKISRESNLPAPWLMSVLYGRAKQPSVTKIQYLYEFLSGTSLDV